MYKSAPNPKIPLIGFHGLKRSGKDTVAAMVYNKLPIIKATPDEKPTVAWNNDSFAAPLREFCNRTFGVTESNRNDRIEALDMTGRELQQKFGTEVGRSINSNFWVESVKQRHGDMRHLLLTDVRFDNEAWFIRQQGGIVVHVLRPGNEWDGHSSEAGIPTALVDYTIMNDGTLEQLKQRAADFVHWYSRQWPFDRDH